MHESGRSGWNDSFCWLPKWEPICGVKHEKVDWERRVGRSLGGKRCFVKIITYRMTLFEPHTQSTHRPCCQLCATVGRQVQPTETQQMAVQMSHSFWEVWGTEASSEFQTSSFCPEHMCACTHTRTPKRLTTHTSTKHGSQREPSQNKQLHHYHPADPAPRERERERLIERGGQSAEKRESGVSDGEHKEG